MIDLSDAPLFAGLRPVELAKIVVELEELAYQAGEVVFRRGEPGDCLYVVREGVAEARAGAGDEADTPLTIYEPGESFGESALLTEEPRSSTVVALTALQLWALPKGRFLSLVETTPSLALAVGRAVSRRLQATHQAVTILRRAFDPVAEVAYAGLDPELQRFLRRTAPLEPVTPEVVARALGRADADQVLTYLAVRLPFVTTEDGAVYRYHPLFRELLIEKLRDELGPDGYRERLRHLAEAAGAAEDAGLAARLLVEAGDRAAAEQIALEHARGLYERRALDELEGFLGALPSELREGATSLLDLQADLLTALGRPEEAVRLLERATREDGHGDEAALARRYRRLAELSFELGRVREGDRWVREAEGRDSGQPIEELEGYVPLPPDGQARGPGGLLALASLAGLRRASGSAGVLGGRGLSKPLGWGLAVGLLGWFLLTPAPAGLSREGYLALGILAAAMPLLVFSVLGDHFVTLLMIVGWAGLGLVPARVALAGFASPGWFLVLAVLAVGVALARVGLLYRLVLWLLARLPPNLVLLTLALAGVGILVSPAMPNATARTALAAPLATEMADALGYARRGRGSAAIGMAMLLGFGQLCSLFLTGSSSGLLVHSLLPPESRARFDFATWFVAALPLHVVIFAITYLSALALLRPPPPAARAAERVEVQQRVLGPPGRAEWIAAGVFVLLVAAFVLGPALRIEAAWAAVVAMVVLGAAGVLDQQGFRSGINWSFLIFFGAMLSLAEVFAALKIDAWLAEAAARPLAPLAASPALFLVAVGLVGYLVNLVVRWQAACVLMTLVLVPVSAPLGIEPWVVGMTALVTTNMWFLPYQSTIYQALYYGADEQAFTHAQARPIALVYGAACLVGLVASVPYWQALGLLPR
jgi:DASS family divalent anion:Na+ symporter